MLLNFIEDIKKIDKRILNFMFSGFKISLLICILSTYMLVLNNCYYTYHLIYRGSIILFQAGLVFACSFLGFGFIIDKIKK